MNPPPPTLRRRLALALAVLIALGVLGVLAARIPRGLHAARVCPRPAGDNTIATGKLPPSATTGLLLVANQQSASASIVDLATGVITHVPAGEEPHDAAVSPDGQSFKSAETEALANGRRVKRFESIEAVARRKLRQLQIAGRLERPAGAAGKSARSAQG